MSFRQNWPTFGDIVTAVLIVSRRMTRLSKEFIFSRMAFTMPVKFVTGLRKSSMDALKRIDFVKQNTYYYLLWQQDLKFLAFVSVAFWKQFSWHILAFFLVKLVFFTHLILFFGSFWFSFFLLLIFLRIEQIFFFILHFTPELLFINTSLFRTNNYTITNKGMA